MTTITKERIELFIKNPLENGLTRGEQMELARSVLASLDAEPAGYHVIRECGKVGCSVATLEEAEKTRDFWNKKWTIRPYFYTAQPALVVPDEWTIQDAVKFCRETGRQDAGSAMEAWNACRSAMLQANQRDLSQPVDPQVADYEKTMLQAGNSPVIPDGWALVPIVPTEDMVINGFESEPDPHFSDEKVWAEYEALSGCRRAARRAELCWAAMIKAAPKPEAGPCTK
ncbi:TPA: hypothetical protein ACGHFT_001175 [Salmonella enterica subsp. enterica serovar Onderstepoort]